MKKTFVLTVIMILPVIGLATHVPDYKIKAALIEKFTRFTSWPFERNKINSQEEFIIAVVGADPVRQYLAEAMVGRSIKDRAVRVQKLASGQNLCQCHVLFIASSEEENLDTILEKTKDKPILTIGSTAGFAQKGVLINFYCSGDNIRFEVNVTALKQSGLQCSAKLLRVARIIK